MKKKTTARKMPRNKRNAFEEMGRRTALGLLRPIDDTFYKRQTKAKLIETIELKEKVETDLIKQVKTLTWGKDERHCEIIRLQRDQFFKPGDEFGRGFYNGMELCLSVIEKREPKYKQNDVAVIQVNEAGAPTRHLGHIDPEKMTPEELVNFFMNVMDGHEMKLPAVLDGMNERILDKLRREAEAHGERAAVARKRFEEAHQGVLRSAKG